MVVTEQFREALKAWVKEKAGRQTELARAIGCNPSNISLLLNRPKDYQTSDLLLGQLRRLKVSDPATYDVIVALLRSKS
jgi:predicted XRE-type DNA-binding protein